MVSRNPLPLRKLALDSVRQTYRHHWNETCVLPRILQFELLREWMNHDVVPNYIRDDFWEIHKDLYTEFSALRPFTAQKFVHLMMLSPEEVPYFADDWNCIIWNYYRHSYEKEFRPCRKLCHHCYCVESKYFKQYSGNVWKERGWTFYHITDHTGVSGENILEDVVWKATSWCSSCLIEPLFDILTTDACRWEFSYHSKRYRVDFFSSDEEEEFIGHNNWTIRRLTAPIVDDNMYSFIKKNPDFW